jgi:hypothetical protein
LLRVASKVREGAKTCFWVRIRLPGNVAGGAQKRPGRAGYSAADPKHQLGITQAVVLCYPLAAASAANTKKRRRT